MTKKTNNKDIFASKSRFFCWGGKWGGKKLRLKIGAKMWLFSAKMGRISSFRLWSHWSAPALTHVSEKYTNQFLVNIGSIKVSEVIGDLYVILEDHQQLKNS